jgi:riboflavin kinase / FMN adenylyltransferase
VLQITDPQQLDSNFSATAIAIGKFDGIHLGHAQLIYELVEYAQEADLVPMVITFDRHPNRVLNPNASPAALVGPSQKLELLAELGIEVCLTLPFTHELSKLSAEDFVNQVLVTSRAKMVFVGEGFRFGAGGLGTVESLREMGTAKGFRVREVSHVMIQDSKVSTTLIRQQLDQGRIELANLMLGRTHRIKGVIEHGKKLGRSFGFPTANFSRAAEGYLPADGVYAGYLIVDGERLPAAHSVGTNDSVAEVPRLIESHVIGRDDLDLYGKVCEAELLSQVRPWARFETVEQLLEQIQQDVTRATQILQEIE